VKTPNERLANERRSRGWSQGRVAEEVGATAKQVSAWEVGDYAPSPHYQEKLCVLFGQSASELGFLKPAIVIITCEEYGMSAELEHAESIINLSWEAWFASRPARAAQEIFKLLPRLDHIRHSGVASIHVLHAQHLAIRAHGLLGALYLDKMENDTALYHYTLAHDIAGDIHDLDQQTTYLALIGDVLRRKDDKLTAISRMELALSKAAQASRVTRGHILQLLAYTHADTGHAPEFEATICEATDLLAHTGEGADTAQHEFIPFEVFEIRGKANRDLGKPLAAIPYLELAEKSLVGESVTPRWHALLEISRSQAFCDAGDLEVGIELAKHGFQMAAQCQSPRQMNRVRKLLKKLETSEHKEDRRVGDLKELLYAHYLG
jgi:transcriptional regulator with XRE-family HTH domain